MNRRTRILIDSLLQVIMQAMGEIEEMGCTCVDRSKGHQRGCRGVHAAKKYEAETVKAAKFLSQ